ncbi:MAG: HAD family hydrolase [Syntrophomonadaceae bacterium]|nr:HAD family hydrolase [Syntrophomonadaceae bacterium]
MFKAVTFDFWDTLFRIPQPELLLERRIDRFQEALRREGHERSREAIRAAFQSCWRRARYAQQVEGREITPRGHVHLIMERLGVVPTGFLFGRLYQAYTRVLLDMPPVFNAGASEVLEKLSRRYRLAVICNTGATPGLVLRKIMADNHIYACFRTLVFSDETAWAKPNPQIFLYTLSRLSVQPEKAVHIGDNSFTDVIGAKRVGMRAVWLSPEAEWTVPECDGHIRHLTELLEIL